MVVEAGRIIRPLVAIGAVGGILEGGKVAFWDSTRFADPSSSGLSHEQLQRTHWAANQHMSGSEGVDIVAGSALMLVSIGALAWAIHGMRQRR